MTVCAPLSVLNCFFFLFYFCFFIFRRCVVWVNSIVEWMVSRYCDWYSYSIRSVSVAYWLDLQRNNREKKKQLRRLYLGLSWMDGNQIIVYGGSIASIRILSLNGASLNCVHLSIDWFCLYWCAHCDIWQTERNLIEYNNNNDNNGVWTTDKKIGLWGFSVHNNYCFYFVFDVRLSVCVYVCCMSRCDIRPSHHFCVDSSHRLSYMRVWRCYCGAGSWRGRAVVIFINSIIAPSWLLFFFFVVVFVYVL